MKSRILLAVLFGAGIAFFPTATAAKGPTAVEIAGPGLDEPIRLDRIGDTRSDRFALMEAAGVYRDFLNPHDDLLSLSAPPGARGPRYLATYYTPVFAEEARTGYASVRQDLYPFAEGGPLVFTPSGQSLLGQKPTTGGWKRVDPALTEALIALGVPSPDALDDRPEKPANATDEWCRPAVELDVAQMRAEASAVRRGPAVEVTLSGSEGDHRARFAGNALDIRYWMPKVRPSDIDQLRLVVPTKPPGAPPIVDAQMNVRSTDLTRVMGRGCAALCLRVTGTAVVGCSWSTYQNREHRLSISYPSSWRPATATVAPLLVDPVIPIALGTYDVPTEGCGAVPGAALRALGPEDAFVAVYVWQFASWGATVSKRPDRFGPDLPWSEGVKCGDGVHGSIQHLNFPDHGLRLSVIAAVGSEASARREREVYRILDTLTVANPG